MTDLQSIVFYCEKAGRVFLDKDNIDWYADGENPSEDTDGYSRLKLGFQCECGEYHYVEIYDN